MQSAMNRSLFGLSGLAVVACCILAVVQMTNTSATSLEVIFPADPATIGGDVYSYTGKSAQDALSRDIAAQKAEYDQEIANMWRRRRQNQATTNDRMNLACNSNPSLPGCPYYPPADNYFVAVDPVRAGKDVYSIEGKVSGDNLKDMVARQKYENMVDKYLSDVRAYQDTVNGDIRLQTACNNNPSLPGCPHNPGPRALPEFGADVAIYGKDVYSIMGRQAVDHLQGDINTAKAQRTAEWYAQQAAQQAAQEAGRQRMAVACANNPTLPGCPY